MNAKSKLRHPLVTSVVLAVLVCLAAAGIMRSGALDSFELQAYDLLVSAKGFAPPPEELVIVDFDDATVQAIGAYLIPRGIVAQVLQMIAAGEPDLIGLDFLLSEKRTAAEDQLLADVLAQAGNVILANTFGTDQQPSSEPLLEFREHALNVAFVNVPIDQDGFIRRIFLAMRTRTYSGVSFPVALASNYLGEPLRAESPGMYRLGATEIALDGIGPNTALIGYWNPRPAHRIISAQQLLKGAIDARFFRKKIVLVGQSNTAAKDLYTTPVFRFRKNGEGRTQQSGVEVHAAALATLLTGKTIRVLERRPLWTLNFLLIWLIVGVAIVVRPTVSLVAVFSLLGPYLLAQVLFSHYGVWMRLVSTEAGMVLALTTGFGYRFADERRLKFLAEVERQSLERELTLARAVQKGLLPEMPPAIDGLDIGVRHETSLLVGGDYYDFILLNPTGLLFVIADVEGKGASSALVMSNLQATLHALLIHVQSLEEIVPALNESILHSAHGKKFVTLFIGVLNVPRLELRYINAGHVPPVVLRANGDTAYLNEGGIVIGLFPRQSYDSGLLQLQPGDVLLAYTDGITEADNGKEQQFECERMVHSARANRQNSAQEIVNAVFREVAAFSAGGTHQDDKVMMAVKVQRAPGQSISGSF